MTSIRQGMTGISNEDLRVWELCSDVPALGNIWAYICFILNVFVPGVGTMLCGCLGDANMNKTQMLIGIVQLLTSVYLLGWVVSVYWGYLIVKKSKGDHNEIRQLMSAAGGNNAEQSNNGVQSNQASAQTKAKKANNPYEDLP